MSRSGPKPLPPRSFDEVLEAFPAYRQSMLGDADNCMLMTRFGLEGGRWTSHAQARGIIGHKFVAELLQTLRRTGDDMVPVEEGLQILYEVCAQRDVPDSEVVVLPARERRLLRIAAIKFVSDNRFNMERLIDVERRLFSSVKYPSASGAMVERQITGRPDALVADPPDGAIVLDWKFTLAAPPKYTGQRSEDHASGVSYLGYFQQRVYGLLVMRAYPAVQRVTLREFYPLVGVARPAVVYFDALEHIEQELATLAEVLDRALMGGSGSEVWQPSPGRHCAFCSRPASCPISPEERATAGGITSRAQAAAVASEFVVADRVRKAHLEALKAYADIYGPVPVKSGKGRYEMRYKRNSTGNGRTFGMHVPEASDRGPEDPDLATAFEQAAQRKREAART